MVNALFDKGRREKLRDALKKGDLAGALRKSLPEPELDLATTRIFERRPPEPPANPPSAWNPDKMQHSQVLAIDGSHNIKKPDQDLFDAIKDGDIVKVRDAINRGADLNSRYPHMPRHRQGDCIIMSNTTPLEYAKKKGDPVIIRLLERNGAKE